MIIEIALAFYGFLGTTSSVLTSLDYALNKTRNCTAEDLFKRCFIRAVKRNSGNLPIFNKDYDPLKIDVDTAELDRILDKLDDSVLGSGEKEKILPAIVPYFRMCLIIPDFQLEHEEIESFLFNVIRDAFSDFYSQLPLTEKSFKQIMLKSIQSEHQAHENQEKFQNKLKEQFERMEDVQRELLDKLPYLNPTVIQKESGRSEFKNPFRIVKAEDFDHNYPLLATLFREPANYDLIRGRDNLILAGGRGCGKSMILRSLAVPTAIEIEATSRNISRLTYKEAGLDYFGIYIKLAKGYFDDLRPDSVISIDAATQLFQHAFNMQLLKATIDTLIECRDRLNVLSISSDVENSIVERIKEILGSNNNSLRTFTELKNTIIAQEKAIGDYLGSIRLGDDAKYSGQFTYVNDFPKEFCRIILDSIPDFNNSRIYFLLDEFENLTEFQQTIINTITKLRPDSITIKLATRALGVKSRIDLQGEPIQSPRDYQMVSLDHNDLRRSEYTNLLIEISEKRLKSEGCLETDIRKLLPSLGYYPELGVEYVRELVSKFLKENREIDFTKLNQKEQDEWVHRMGVAVTFRERKGMRNPKIYAGFNSFVDCSSGIVSNFLELCKIAFYLAESSGEKVREGEPIQPDTQNDAIYLVSRAYLDWIPRNIPLNGPKISRLLLDFGDIFREKLLNHNTEPEAARIIIKDPEKLDEKKYEGVADILDDAVRWSVFHAKGPASAYSPKHKLDVRSEEYTINRIIIPSLEISPRPRWRTQFNVNDIDTILDSEKRALTKKRLMKKLSGKTTIKRKDKTISDFGHKEEK